MAFGLIWGLGLFCLTWWIIVFDGATGETTIIEQVHRGFNINPMRSLSGLVWAFADGAIGGAIFSWLYNIFVSSRLIGKRTD